MVTKIALLSVRLLLSSRELVAPHRRRLVVASIVLISLLNPAMAPSARAEFEGAGFVIGALALSRQIGSTGDELAATAERVGLLLRELESQTNLDVHDRIEQFRSIIAMVLDSVDRDVATLKSLADSAIQKLSDLESKLYLDFENIIEKLSCWTKDISQADGPALVTNMINVVRQSFGAKSIENESAAEIFRRYEGVQIKKIKSLTESSPAWTIYETYSDLSRTAMASACSYPNHSLESYLLEKGSVYELLAKPWNGVIKVESLYEQPQIPAPTFWHRLFHSFSFRNPD